MVHRRTSGTVKSHSSFASLSQQGTEAEPGWLGVLGLTHPCSPLRWSESLSFGTRPSRSTTSPASKRCSTVPRSCLCSGNCAKGCPTPGATTATGRARSHPWAPSCGPRSSTRRGWPPWGVPTCSWSTGTLRTATRGTKTAERNSERDTDRREPAVGGDWPTHSIPLVRPRPDSSHASSVSILSPRRNAARAITKVEMGVVTSRNTPMRIAL